MRAPRLKPISLARATEHRCPGVVVGKKLYLAKIGGEFHLGRFGREWYGLNFDTPAYGAGIQFDAPGSNSSEWEALWELIP
jgi:hypothetical protein